MQQLNVFLITNAPALVSLFMVTVFVMLYRATRTRNEQGQRIAEHILHVGTQNTSGRMRYHTLIAQGYEVVAHTDKGVLTMRKIFVYK